MKRKLIWILIIVLISSGCMTLKQKDYLIESDSEAYLPNLMLTADWQNLKRTIKSGHEKVEGDINHSGILNDIVIHHYDLRHRKVPDARIFDALRVFAYEMKGNIADTTASFYEGSISFAVDSFDVKWSKGLAFLSVYLLGVPQLVGIPANVVKTNTTVTITFRDDRGNVLKNYQASGFGLARIGMYWAYGEDGWRISAVEAFREAISEITWKARKDDIFEAKQD